MDRHTNRAAHDEARHNAEETLRMTNADLRNPRIANNARRRHMLTTMKREAMATIAEHDRMYGDRNDRHNDDYRNNNRNDRYNYRHNDYRSDNDRRMDMIHDAMDVVDRILPHITGEMDDYTVENRRGVFRSRPGHRRDGRKTSPYRGGKKYHATADMNNYSDDYSDDWEDDAENRQRADDMARTAATAAANTARRMMDDRNRSDYYPPVMPRQDKNDDRRTMDEDAAHGARPGTRR